jgi:hypothetical protein
MTLDYTDLRKEYVEKSKIDRKRYGRKVEAVTNPHGRKVEAVTNPQLSENDEKRKEFWSYLMASYTE